MAATQRAPSRANPIRALALAVIALACATAVRAHALRVDLHGSADVAAAQVTLADIATVNDADDARLARLRALDVGRVSADGTPTVVDRVALARWVLARSGLRSTDIVWSGASQCSVRLVAAPIQPAAPVANMAAVPAAGAAQPAVTRGKLATLHAVNGPISLDSSVEVLEDGAVGQDVRVRMPGANEGIVARVTAPGHVEVLQ